MAILSKHSRIRTRFRHSFLRDLLLWYRHRGFTENDVFLTSFPKSGKTWLRFMLIRLLAGKDLDLGLQDRYYSPPVGWHVGGYQLLPNNGRLIMTHEMYRPGYKRAIYIVRDGRDAAVSHYWHYKRTSGHEIEFSDFLEGYLVGLWSGYGTWHQHVQGFLNSPTNQSGNLLLIKYEDMKRDIHRELTRACHFLKAEVSPEEITSAIEASSLEKMRKAEQNSASVLHMEKGAKIPVVRKGIVGDWKNQFSQSDLERFAEVAEPAMQLAGYSCFDHGFKEDADTKQASLLR